MRVRFSDSEQWSSPVKPPRSQNYVKPHNARTRVHVAKVHCQNQSAPDRNPAMFDDQVNALCIASSHSGLDQGDFTEGHELDRKWQVPKEMAGRRLSQGEAKRLLAKFGWGQTFDSVT